MYVFVNGLCWAFLNFHILFSVANDVLGFVLRVKDQVDTNKIGQWMLVEGLCILLLFSIMHGQKSVYCVYINPMHTLPIHFLQIITIFFFFVILFTTKS